MVLTGPKFMSFTSIDRQTMIRALHLAELGLNTTTPNPRVGCVLADSDGTVLAEGYHRKAGEPHAEVIALDNAADKAKGATAYITLEPCCHQGRTGPCSDALIKAGVTRVVYAMEDPNPRVAGQGLARLRQAGIEVDGPLMEEAARTLNPGFIKRMTVGLPFVRLKMAMSLDGRTAMKSGESKWITGPSARQDVQRLRARSCAILTGVGSVIQDNPALTVRLDELSRQPLRVIVDSQVKSPLEAEIFTLPGRTVIACCDAGAGAKSQFEAWVLPERAGRVDLEALLRKLAEEGCNEVLIETGATLAGAFVGLGLVDEFVIYMAAKLLGSEARPLFDLPIGTMSGRLPLTVQDIRAVGDDFRITATPDPEG